MTCLLRRNTYLSVFILLIFPLVLSSDMLRATTVEAASTQIYWGAYIKGNTYGFEDAPWDTRTLDTFESHAGKKVAIMHWGQPWFWSTRGGYQVFQRSMVEKMRLRGSIPMITWTSEDLSAGNSTNQAVFQLGDIINGQHDAYIRQWARDAKAWGYPFFIRLNHEMNGDWYHWSEVRNGNSRGQYAKMWQHVVNIFRQEGATNATWVWAPNRVWSGGLDLQGLYPGDSYVDWLGMSGYNWGTNPAKPNNSWLSFDEVFKQTYDQFGSLAPSKPIMITETSSSEYGGSKSTWITDVITTALPTKYPRVNAFLWFNWNHPEQNGNIDWVIESSGSAQAAFAKSIASSYYATNTFGDLPAFSKVKLLTSSTPNTTGIANGSFETAVSTPWYHPWMSGNTLNAAFTQDGTTSATGSKSIKVILPAASSALPWSVQLRQEQQMLNAGKTYTITFYAKASASRSLTVVLQDSNAPYTEYFKQLPTLSTTWTKYSYTYRPTISDSNASLAFNLAQASGQVWLDNISLSEQ